MPVHDWTRVKPNSFHDFHSAWIAEIRSALNRGLLPDDHYAALEQSSQDAVPDVITLRTGGLRTDDDWRQLEGGVVAVAEHPPKVSVLAECELFSDRQKHITIRHSEGAVVAIIELVSPENKRTVAQLNKFTAKIESALAQEIHVLVIDLFPPGTHDPQGIHGAIWERLPGDSWTQPSSKPLTVASYESAGAVRAYVEPLAVGDTIPPMPVFLAPGWYVNAPLESTYVVAWEGTPRPWRQMITG